MATAWPLLRTALATAALVSLTLTACGSPEATKADAPKKADKTPAFSDKSGPEVLAAATTAMSDAKVVHIKGSLAIDGVPTTLNVRRDAKGTCAGTMSQGGTTFQFVSTAGAAFLKGDAKFWGQSGGSGGALVVKLLGGKWAKLAGSDQIDGVCDISALLSQAGGEPDSFQGAPKPVPGTLNGHQVLKIKVSKGEDSYTLVVDVAEPHYLLKFINNSKVGTGAVAFSEFGKVAPIHVPTAAESKKLG